MADKQVSRTGSVSRKTNETSVTVSVNIDGTGTSRIATGVGFFDHMLEQLSRHSLIDMDIVADGDRHVDDHHTVEDTGIAIGQALSKALGDRRGITRYASLDLAMGRNDDPRCRRCFRPAVSLSGTSISPPRRSAHSTPELVARVLPGSGPAWRHHAACAEYLRR